jgi:hypothetical protein
MITFDPLMIEREDRLLGIVNNYVFDEIDLQIIDQLKSMTKDERKFVAELIDFLVKEKVEVVAQNWISRKQG